MGATSRRKGADGERELAALLAAELGPVARNLLQPRQGGYDLEGPGLTGWALEVKRTQRWPGPLQLEAWWLQTKRQARAAGAMPALAVRADRGTWRVLVSLAQLRPDIPSATGAEHLVALTVPAYCCVVREGLGGGSKTLEESST